ncbi:MAG: hypothetical protein ABI632_07780 [Pseudolysinimonas sp.]
MSRTRRRRWLWGIGGVLGVLLIVIAIVAIPILTHQDNDHAAPSDRVQDLHLPVGFAP